MERVTPSTSRVLCEPFKFLNIGPSFSNTFALPPLMIREEAGVSFLISVIDVESALKMSSRLDTATANSTPMSGTTLDASMKPMLSSRARSGEMA